MCVCGTRWCSNGIRARPPGSASGVGRSAIRIDEVLEVTVAQKQILGAERSEVLRPCREVVSAERREVLRPCREVVSAERSEVERGVATV